MASILRGGLPAGALMAVDLGPGHEYLEQMRAHEAGIFAGIY